MNEKKKRKIENIAFFTVAVVVLFVGVFELILHNETVFLALAMVILASGLMIVNKIQKHNDEIIRDYLEGRK